MAQEEALLFPAIEALAAKAAGARAGALTPPVASLIAAMEGEHDAAGAALARLREITQGFTPSGAHVKFLSLVSAFRPRAQQSSAIDGFSRPAAIPESTRTARRGVESPELRGETNSEWRAKNENSYPYPFLRLSAKSNFLHA